MTSQSHQQGASANDGIDDIVERFEDAWERGDEPLIDDYLPANDNAWFAALVELVHVDLERRIGRGAAARTEDYVQRFPALVGDAEACDGLVVAEVQLRRRRGELQSLDDIQCRFPTQFARLRERLVQECQSRAAAPASPSTPTTMRNALPEQNSLPLQKAGEITDTDRLPEIPGYTIQSVLGEGGAAIVYLAWQLTPRRQVAIKMIHTARGRVDELSLRLRAEADALAQLQHPNIVQVFEVGQYQGQPFLVMEYLDGGSLHDRLIARPLGFKEAATLVRTLAIATEAAHNRGIIHRDLKPSNVLFCCPDNVKITDFGLAKQLESDAILTQTGEILGTPSFMAPEQAVASHATVGRPTDVYALGAILYAALCGRPPFKSASVIETLEQVRKSEPVRPSFLVPKLPRDLETICLKCLEKQPQQRYSTAAELAIELERFLRNEPIHAHPISQFERGLRWCQRNRLAAMLAASVLLTFALGTAISTVFAVQASRRAIEAEQANHKTEQSLLAEIQSRDKAQSAEHTAKVARETAETQAATTAEVSGFLVNLFMTADPLGTGRLGFRQGDEVGTNITLRELLDRGSRQARHAHKDRPVARATLLETLGRVYCNLGQMDQAEPLVRDAYKLRLEHPENEAELASSLLNMGVLLRWKGEYAEAERLLRQALEIRTRLAGHESHLVAEVEFPLGWTLLETKRFGSNRDSQWEREFDTLMQHVLATQRRELGDSHRDVGLTLVFLTLRLFMQGKQAEAEKMLSSNVDVFMQQEGGPPLLVGALELQAASKARREHKYDEAEKHYRSCLDTLRKVVGNSHPFSLGAAADLGGMYREQGRMVDFERNAREVIGAAEPFLRAFPSGHPWMIEPITIMEEVVASQGKFDEAIAFLEKKIEIEARFFNLPSSRRVLTRITIAEIFVDQGRLDECAALLDEIQGVIDHSPLDGDREAASLRHRMVQAALELARGNLALSERVYRECMNEPSHGELPLKQLGLAMAIHRQRVNDVEAEQLLRESKAHLSGLLPTYPWHVLPHLALAQLLIDRERPDEADGVLRPAYEFVHQKTIPGNYYIGIADSLMGAYLAAKEQDKDAEPQLVAGLENLRKSRGDHHWLTRDARDRLVSFYRQTGRDEEADQYAGVLKAETSLPSRE